jgi:hypothetical protein
MQAFTFVFFYFEKNLSYFMFRPLQSARSYNLQEEVCKYTVPPEFIQ